MKRDRLMYRYRGDRLTCDSLRGVTVFAVLRADGKCVRGANGSMLVCDVQGRTHVVLARQLRRLR